MRGQAKPKKHQRRIRISVMLPASVEMIVGTNEDDPSEDSDWEILSVVKATCADVSPRAVSEQMHDIDIASLGVAAANAEDEK